MVQVKENGKSERYLVMRWIGVQNLPQLERVQTSIWFLITRELVEFLKGESK